jgi:hypothetical protein
VIAALATGYVLMAQLTGLPDRSFFIGWLLFYGAFVVAGFLRVLGPRFTATVLHPLDERELMVKARAHAVSGIVLANLAMLGCFYMASAGVPGLWYPHTPSDWLNLDFGLWAVGMLLPTWIASWLEPQRARDNED